MRIRGAAHHGGDRGVRAAFGADGHLDLRPVRNRAPVRVLLSSLRQWKMEEQKSLIPRARKRRCKI